MLWRQGRTFVGVHHPGFASGDIGQWQIGRVAAITECTQVAALRLHITQQHIE